MGRTALAAPLTYSIQDYLKKIYELTGDGKPASTTALATRLGISPGSVTGMLQKMAAGRPALVSLQETPGGPAYGERPAGSARGHPSPPTP